MNMKTRELENVRTRLYVADNLALRRASIISLLRAAALPVEIVGLESVEELLARSIDDSFDREVILLSLGGLSMSSVVVQSWVGQIRNLFADVALVILSDHDEPDELATAYHAGARGFLPMSLDAPVALRALEVVLAGGVFFPPTFLSETPVLAHRKESPRPIIATLSGLTPRQTKVLDCLRQGKPNKVIARELDMSEATVKVHVREIIRKLGVRNRTQAALHAMPGGERRNGESYEHLDLAQPN